jgi:hypothetical protein
MANVYLKKGKIDKNSDLKLISKKNGKSFCWKVLKLTKIVILIMISKKNGKLILTMISEKMANVFSEKW